MSRGDSLTAPSAPDRRFVIVTHFNEAQAHDVVSDGGTRDRALSKMYILDVQSGDLHRIAAFDVCVMVHGVAVSADGSRAYLACNGEDMLGVVHLDSPEHVVDPYYLGAVHGLGDGLQYAPYAVLPTSDGQYAAVSDLGGRVQFFNTATHQFDASVAAPGAVLFGTESADGMYLYFPTQNTDGVLRIRRSDFDPVFYPVAHAQCLSPHEISRGPDGRP